ncbi:hypothetical protein GMOD_00006087 [Pyrenophora seminiperda CCB06]|uniref:Uncharacterized protein n=1 Tax=Pyrenophora seminiperda CCB06 TaxID=1302712 RepID=A0A3M7M485_9PLEO|nr:hypothetical protein GMOD_00006087 [Pyrenophora seminiperda CCB06]
MEFLPASPHLSAFSAQLSPDSASLRCGVEPMLSSGKGGGQISNMQLILTYNSRLGVFCSAKFCLVGCKKRMIHRSGVRCPDFHPAHLIPSLWTIFSGTLGLDTPAAPSASKRDHFCVGTG